jgi:hypothetical protein
MVNVLKAIFPILMLSVRHPRFDRLYDKRATLECHCDGVTLIGRPSIAAYWAPKLALASATAFSMDDVLLIADGVCLDFRNYEGEPSAVAGPVHTLGQDIAQECGLFGQRCVA